MKQVLQNLSTGHTTLMETPCPGVMPGQLLICAGASLISAGTERMLVRFAKSNIINKIYRQPARIRAVLDKVRTDGLFPTFNAVVSKLDQPLPLGYCHAGRVIDADMDDRDSSLLIGSRVVSNGPHAELVSVSKNLCARIPEGVSDEEAAFTVVGAIALQGLRLAQPSLGENFVVIGLGLIGQIAVQLLRANGCRVMGIDIDPAKCVLAGRFGAETTVALCNDPDPVSACQSFSQGKGADGVIITTATTDSEPVRLAALMSRKRGRIILVGTAGLALSQDDFYRKELSFQVSCSYGPGRHDPEYEEKGLDYPLPYVRWTEKRNFEAVLDLMAAGSLDVKPLISHRLPIDRIQEAYGLLMGIEPYLGIILTYDKRPCRCAAEVKPQKTISLQRAVQASQTHTGTPIVAFIGAGNHAGRTLIPAFRNSGAILESIASRTGVNAVHLAKKHGFSLATTDVEDIFSSNRVNTVVIATRHDTHAQFTISALMQNKNVFVEKPLCLSLAQLREIEDFHAEISRRGVGPMLMVGFNRRFAPHVRKIRELLSGLKQPKSFIMSVNAGAVSADHWTQNPDLGGGGIIGEACHFIDLLRFLADSPMTSCKVTRLLKGYAGDNVIISFTYSDGSIGSIHYFTNGHRSLSKERLEVFCAGRALQLDNFRRLRGYGWPSFRKMNLWRQDKGGNACAAAFLEAVRESRPSPIPFEEIIEVSRTTIEIASGSHD